ncbi:hypothetical protein T06_11117 [Trichinella sp. T6]|nr:hypothetical protein T06_11117 [Trichinella sp. T6]
MINSYSHVAIWQQRSFRFCWLWSSYPLSPGFCICRYRHAATGFSRICIVHFCQGFCNIQPIRSLLPRGVSKKNSPVPFSTSVIYSIQCSQHPRQIYAAHVFVVLFYNCRAGHVDQDVEGTPTSLFQLFLRFQWRVLQSVSLNRPDGNRFTELHYNIKTEAATEFLYSWHFTFIKAEVVQQP